MVHAVRGEMSDRQLDHVVRKVLEREQARSAHPDVDRRAAQPPRGHSHARPRVLLQVAHAHVEHGAADEVDGVEAGIVGKIEHRRDHGVRHPRRPKALVPVAHRDIDQVDLGHGLRSDRRVSRDRGRRSRCQRRCRRSRGRALAAPSPPGARLLQRAIGAPPRSAGRCRTSPGDSSAARRPRY